MSSEETEEERWFAEHLLPHEAMLRGWLASRYPTGVDIDDVIQEAYSVSEFIHALVRSEAFQKK